MYGIKNEKLSWRIRRPARLRGVVPVLSSGRMKSWCWSRKKEDSDNDDARDVNCGGVGIGDSKASLGDQIWRLR
jgi:hypothetical protein